MTYNGFPNRETWAASLTVSEFGWNDVAEDAIDAWCAKHWDSYVPTDVAGALTRDALLAEPEFLADLAKTASDVPASIDLINWVWIGYNLVEAMSERRGA